LDLSKNCGGMIAEAWWKCLLMKGLKTQVD